MTRRWQYHRSSTPSPIKHPIVNNDDDDSDDEHENGSYDWFYGADAGGAVLNFGKHRGQKIHDTSISYLYWCYRTFRYNHPVLQAFRIYHAGLVEHAKTAYGDFVVPFGWTHKGKTIRQCRDKRWLLWTMRQKILTDKYTIFFIAVQHWLDNPRHYEVTRDIGKLLSLSEYEDGIDLSGANEYQNEGDPTLADDADADDEDEYDDDYDGDGVPTQADLDFIDDGPVEDGVTSDEEEFERAGPSSYDPSRSSETQKKRKTRKKSRKMRSAESRSELNRDFIVPDDDEALDSEDYLTSDTELSHESPMRVTRSAAKKLGEAEKRRETTVSPTSSRVHKRDKRPPSVVLFSRNAADDDDDVPKSNGMHPGYDEDDEDQEDEDEHDTLPSFDLSRHTKKVVNRTERTKRRMKEESDSEVEFVEAPNVFSIPRRRQELPNGSDDEEEEEEEITSPSKCSRAMVVISPPESEGEADEEDPSSDEDDDEDEQRGEVPITPPSRFLNRKRILTSDSEADETTLSTEVRSPRKKLRVKPEALSEIKVESDEDVVVSPTSSRKKMSHSMKGKWNAKALEVNGHTDKPTKAWYIDIRVRGPGSTSRDHRRGSQYSSPSKSHRSQVTE